VTPGCRRLVLTPGEPAGIGPELLVQLVQSGLPHELVAIADPELLQQRAAAIGLPLLLEAHDSRQAPRPTAPGRLQILPRTLPATAAAGRLDPANAPYVLDCLRAATQGCLRGEFDALVTGPVHKGVINEAGLPFTGHTEFLAGLSDTPRVVMLLATGGLRVALATTHLPLREVADALTPAVLEETLLILDRDLRRRFGLARPRIRVLGLNPHAGEGGHLGREEIGIIMPVLDALRARGLELEGPVPADTAFHPERLGDTDAILAMYHDQGLPVLKYRGFGQAVNITLGLPFVRTSVDHGTALELAGSGRADPGSLRFAVDTAVAMVEPA